MIKRLLLVMLVLLVLLAGSWGVISAQGPYQLSRGIFVSSSGPAGDGQFALQGIAGHLAVSPASDGLYTLQGGFFFAAGLDLAASSLYLPIILR